MDQISFDINNFSSSFSVFLMPCWLPNKSFSVNFSPSSEGQWRLSRIWTFEGLFFLKIIACWQSLYDVMYYGQYLEYESLVSNSVFVWTWMERDKIIMGRQFGHFANKGDPQLDICIYVAPRPTLVCYLCMYHFISKLPSSTELN